MDFHLSTAGRRYLFRMIGALVSYGVAVTVVPAWLASGRGPTGALLWAVAIVPAAPILGAIRAIGLYLVEETDEYQKMFLTTSILWATGITLAAATAWGSLETYAHARHAGPFDAFVLFCAALGVVQGVRKAFERAMARA